jgi:DNA adenine methylase
MSKPFSPPIKRLGTKTKIMQKLIAFFPEHDAFIEPFSGSGSVFFNKPQALYKFLNDADANIALTYNMLQDPEQTAALIDYLEFVPYSVQIWEQIKKMQPQNDIERVAKFLILSNWSYMGTCNSLILKLSSPKCQMLKLINATVKLLANGKIKWHSCDFEKFLANISISDDLDRSKSFIYCDPPYLNTYDNYDTPAWKVEDLERLILACQNKVCKFAISEFDSPDVLNLQNKYGLHLNIIGEVKNMKNRRTEILLTNYTPSKQQKIF